MILQKGPSSRRPKNEKNYINHRRNKQNDGCDFCKLVTDGGDQVVSEQKHCMVIKNLFSYDIWDDCGVIEHLMIIPKKHTDSLSSLTTAERNDYWQTLTDFEDRGYSLYARAPSNGNKSVVHQHTHLIKTDNSRKKWIVHIRRPHVLWVK